MVSIGWKPAWKISTFVHQGIFLHWIDCIEIVGQIWCIEQLRKPIQDLDVLKQKDHQIWKYYLKYHYPNPTPYTNNLGQFAHNFWTNGPLEEYKICTELPGRKEPSENK